MSYIRFEQLWEDSDGMVQLLISLSNDIYSCEQDIYVYPEEIITFGQQLEKFPKNLEDEATLEYGLDNPNYYSSLLLRAYVYNQTGHVALEFKINNNAKNNEHSSAHFHVLSEPIFLNKIGRQLKTWAKNMQEPYKYEWEIIKNQGY